MAILIDVLNNEIGCIIIGSSRKNMSLNEKMIWSTKKHYNYDNITPITLLAINSYNDKKVIKKCSKPL